jgi:hypothetical protein
MSILKSTGAGAEMKLTLQVLKNMGWFHPFVSDNDHSPNIHYIQRNIPVLKQEKEGFFVEYKENNEAVFVYKDMYTPGGWDSKIHITLQPKTLKDLCLVLEYWDARNKKEFESVLEKLLNSKFAQIKFELPKNLTIQKDNITNYMELKYGGGTW